MLISDAHSSDSSGSSGTLRTEMLCVDAERQIGCRPLCTMATCWPPCSSFRFFSSSMALQQAPTDVQPQRASLDVSSQMPDAQQKMYR